jgi:hypothetical protein
VSRTRLGAWRCPSGNGVDVFFRRGADGIARIEFEWDTLPLRGADQLDYVVRIRPEALRRVAEFTEQPGPAALIELR